jgi:hypothetical protein
MQPAEIVAYVGNLIPLGIKVLNMVDDVIQLIDKPTLPALDISQFGVHAWSLTSNILEVSLAGNTGKVLIENPAKANQMLHELGPWNAMVWVFTPAAKIRFQFN